VKLTIHSPRLVRPRIPQLAGEPCRGWTVVPIPQVPAPAEAKFAWSVVTASVDPTYFNLAEWNSAGGVVETRTVRR
jgi:hypothetical protein